MEIENYEEDRNAALILRQERLSDHQALDVTS